jgi:ABC-type nitrate/sulfonate/bicarbonate transport system permease component
LPAILNALQIAVPTAFLGAVLGEYMGATDRSVGILLIRLQGNLDSERVWAVFLLCAAVALIGYGLVGLLARLVTPWISGRSTT